MKKNRFLLFPMAVMFLIVGSFLVNAQIEKKIIVRGKVFSQEPDSKSLIIITSDELQQLKIANLTDLFSLVTMAHVNRRGEGDSSFDFSLRGSNFEQVLVLINGIPINNPQTGHFNCDLPFNISDIDRIEIVRGGNSTQFGSGSFAGVVNIVLKAEKKTAIDLTIGEHKFAAYDIQLGQKIKDFCLNLSYGRLNSSGFYPGRELDQSRLATGIQFAKRDWQIQFFAGLLTRKMGAAGFYAPLPSIEEIKGQFYSIQLQKEMPTWKYGFTYSYQYHDDFFVLDRYRPDYFQNSSQTGLNHLKITASHSRQSWKFNSGIEFKWDDMSSLIMGDQHRSNQAGFFNFNYHQNKWGLDGGIRLDISDYFTAQVTFFSGFSRWLGKQVLLKIIYNNAFRHPSFTELYYQSPTNQGDPYLKSEASQNIEISCLYFHNNWSTDFSLFYRPQTHMIDWVKSGNSQIWQAINIDKNDILGGELTWEFHHENTQLWMGMEKLFLFNPPKGFISKYGFRFPDWSFKFNISQMLLKNLVFISNYSYKQIFKTTQKGHFVNLGLIYSLNHIDISLKVDNLFNTIIEEIEGIKIPGCWFYLRFSYH